MPPLCERQPPMQPPAPHHNFNLTLATIRLCTSDDTRMPTSISLSPTVQATLRLWIWHHRSGSVDVVKTRLTCELCEDNKKKLNEKNEHTLKLNNNDVFIFSHDESPFNP
ncbi:hypothetical protein AAZX31_19G144100 [Glycine max]|nr:hypothetical protein GLYMA_19G158351v4 [Glycine max]KAH1078023.1 hypothetical protein GYH30_053199 [Glycine max]